MQLKKLLEHILEHTSDVITSEDVMSKIMNFKDGKAPGNDGIIPEFLKHIVKEISEPLAIIYNKWFHRNGKEPTLLHCLRKEHGQTQGIIDLSV